MTKKLPYINLFPGDWLRDNVAGCSLSAQALWLRLMFIMHDSQRYGYLTVNGSAASDEWAASRVGCPVEKYRELLAELDRAGVPSRTSDGIIFSRRMVRDAEKRANDAQRQRKHRGQTCHDVVTPLSRPPNTTSSSSISISNPPSPTFDSNRKGENGGGDDGLELTDWGKIAARLSSHRVNAVSGAIKSAKNNGLTASQVSEIIDHWESHAGSWSPGYLKWRVSEGVPSQAATEGWPPPKSTTANAKQEKKSNEALAYRIIKAGQRHGKTEDQIRVELKSAGLEWPN